MANNNLILSNNLSWALWILSVCDAQIEPFVHHQSIAQDPISLKYLPGLRDTKLLREKLKFNENQWEDWFTTLVLQEYYDYAYKKERLKESREKLLAHPLAKNVCRGDSSAGQWNLEVEVACVTEERELKFSKTVLGLSKDLEVKEYLQWLYNFWNGEDEFCPRVSNKFRKMADGEEDIFLVPHWSWHLVTGISTIRGDAANNLKRYYSIPANQKYFVDDDHKLFIFPNNEYKNEEPLINNLKVDGSNALFKLNAFYAKKMKVNLHLFGLPEVEVWTRY